MYKYVMHLMQNLVSVRMYETQPRPSHPLSTRSVGLVAKLLHSKWRTANTRKVAPRPPRRIKSSRSVRLGERLHKTARIANETTCFDTVLYIYNLIGFSSCLSALYQVITEGASAICCL